jgi:hypothetical protein
MEVGDLDAVVDGGRRGGGGLGAGCGHMGFKNTRSACRTVLACARGHGVNDVLLLK